MIGSYRELDSSHIDVLREIGNIGAGNAATSLSVMLDESVHIGIPQVRLLDCEGIVRALGAPETLGLSILVRYAGDASGAILFLISHDEAKVVSEMLTGGFSPAPGTDDEMMYSAIKEIGNILSSSYLGSIATLTGLKFDISVPHASVDKIGAIMGALIDEFSEGGDKFLLIEESFSTDVRSLVAHVILFADILSLNKIFGGLQID